jgi:hypothetical protein
MLISERTRPRSDHGETQSQPLLSSMFTMASHEVMEAILVAVLVDACLLNTYVAVGV